MKKVSNEYFAYWYKKYQKSRSLYGEPWKYGQDAILWLIENDSKNRKRMKTINKIINEYINIEIYGIYSKEPYAEFTINIPREVSEKLKLVYGEEYKKLVNANNKQYMDEINNYIEGLN